MSETSVATRQPASVKDFLALPAYKDRFAEVMGKRANQFMASIVAVSQMPSLRDANPKSVIAAAMVSATLDLPVNPTLGLAHIVAYKAGGSDLSEAQFQIGYKGLIQLALRSGQYRKMNAGGLNAGVFSGYDSVGEPALDFSKFDPTKEIVGYFCAFELTNSFTKVVYWPKAQVEAHAKRFSKAYSKGFKGSPWFSDFDGMATKTVIKNAITKWGILSVELQKAVVHDQGAQTDIDADVKFVDGVEVGVEAPKTTKKAPDLLGMKKAKAEVLPVEKDQLKAKLEDANIAESDLIKYLREGGVIDESLSSLDEINEVAPAAIKSTLTNWESIARSLTAVAA